MPRTLPCTGCSGFGMCMVANGDIHRSRALFSNGCSKCRLNMIAIEIPTCQGHHPVLVAVDTEAT